MKSYRESKNMHTDKTPSGRKSGFTLIELSIVLVIIGLIVGGILVGQDLIRAAQIRATVAQLEKYNTAVNTFNTKYNGVPGDLTAATASNFGLTSDTSNSYGNGNGLIDGSVANAAWVQESGLFWVQLSQANMIEYSFSNTAATLSGAAPIAFTSASISGIMPLTKIGKGYISASSYNGSNYFIVGGIMGTTVGGNLTVNGATSLTPIQAYNIDIKIDDGAPSTGIVQAHGNASNGTVNTLNDTTYINIAATPGYCAVGTGTAATDFYNIAGSSGSTPICIIRTRFN